MSSAVLTSIYLRMCTFFDHLAYCEYLNFERKVVYTYVSVHVNIIRLSLGVMNKVAANAVEFCVLGYFFGICRCD